jgi:hypothetical protein
MEAALPFETSINFYHITMRLIQQVSNIQQTDESNNKLSGREGSALSRIRKLPASNPGPERDILPQVLIFLSPPTPANTGIGPHFRSQSLPSTSLQFIIYYSSYNRRCTA